MNAPVLGPVAYQTVSLFATFVTGTIWAFVPNPPLPPLAPHRTGPAPATPAQPPGTTPPSREAA